MFVLCNSDLSTVSDMNCAWRLVFSSNGDSAPPNLADLARWLLEGGVKGVRVSKLSIPERSLPSHKGVPQKWSPSSKESCDISLTAGETKTGATRLGLNDFGVKGKSRSVQPRLPVASDLMEVEALGCCCCRCFP